MKFMDVHHDMTGVTREQLAKEHQKDLDIQGAEGVKFLKAWVDPQSGRAFCLSEGPNKDAVMRVHAKAGHPTQEIYEVPIEV